MIDINGGGESSRMQITVIKVAIKFQYAADSEKMRHFWLYT